MELLKNTDIPPKAGALILGRRSIVSQPTRPDSIWGRLVAIYRCVLAATARAPRLRTVSIIELARDIAAPGALECGIVFAPHPARASEDCPVNAFRGRQRFFRPPFRMGEKVQT
jgi:hypothetical protein